tara:strand:+ start:273 stop:449 length:177 start_codon:yes stop_codon:yes gene_type:complete
MKNWMINFVKDERGVESAEFAVASVSIAGGTAAVFTTIKGNLKDKGDALINAIAVDAG